METTRDVVVLVRHGETEWSRSGQHTSFTELPLTEIGRAQAEAIGEALRDRHFARVLTSPLIRARDTCEIAGLLDVAVETDDLKEWQYGEYEGRTTADIRTEAPGWTVWTHPSPGGETAAEVGARADRVIAAVLDVNGDVALFSHGHMLRVLAARWIGLPPDDGRLFALSTATISVLGWERDVRVIQIWNETPAGAA